MYLKNTSHFNDCKLGIGELNTNEAPDVPWIANFNGLLFSIYK